jgi:small-conductance mechanosensitive channel
MQTRPKERSARSRAGRTGIGALATIAITCLSLSGATSSGRQGGGEAQDAPSGATLEETRLTLSTWLETQRVVAKERNEWQQGKEILLGRLDLVKKEIATLQERLAEAESSAAKANEERDALLAENEQLDAVAERLTAAVAGLEGEVRKLLASIPEPIRTRLEKLIQRMPQDPGETRVVPEERFQNVLGILNDLNQANNELTVSYEVRALADGKPAEVRALYVGLALGYYVSAKGEAGIGRPAADGWSWESSSSIADEVLTALEIIQQKQSPAFVPLPGTLR